MITAIDTEGNTYFSLTQTNTNSHIMDIFFKQLILKLDKERINWRSDTVILIDNAPYHNSAQTLQMFEDFNIPIMFTGPHSYDAAPCELWFARFKAVDINPQRLPLGK